MCRSRPNVPFSGFVIAKRKAAKPRCLSRFFMNFSEKAVIGRAGAPGDLQWRWDQ
jgi:hypothetical protein